MEHSREAPPGLKGTTEAGFIAQWVPQSLVSQKMSAMRRGPEPWAGGLRMGTGSLPGNSGTRGWGVEGEQSFSLKAESEASAPWGAGWEEALPPSGVPRRAGCRVAPGQGHPGEAGGSRSPWHGSSPHVPRDTGGCS